MILNIFDFDQTITKEHTVINRELTPENNTKSGVGDYLKHDAETISAIASYHNDPSYIKAYLEHILGQDLNKVESQSSDYYVLTRFEIAGEEDEAEKNPLYVCTLNPENYQFHRKKVSRSGKNTQILAIKNALHKHGVPTGVETKFFDDDLEMITHAQSLPNVTTCLIHNSNEEAKESFTIGDVHSSLAVNRAWTDKYLENENIQKKFKLVELLQAVQKQEISDEMDILDICWHCANVINDALVYPEFVYGSVDTVIIRTIDDASVGTDYEDIDFDELFNQQSDHDNSSNRSPLFESISESDDCDELTRKICDATSNAQRKYAKWYKGEEEHRGKNGFFTSNISTIDDASVGTDYEEIDLDELLNQQSDHDDSSSRSPLFESISESDDCDELTRKIRDATSKAQRKYAKWYIGEEEHRGKNGFFTRFRHGKKGQRRAEALVDEVFNAEGSSVASLEKFLNSKKTRFNNHSFASFLRDELEEKGIKVTPPKESKGYSIS